MKTQMRSFALSIILLSFLASAALPLLSARAQNQSTASALSRLLENDLDVTPAELAALLTRSAVHLDPDMEPRLARWEKSSLIVTILETGAAQDDVNTLLAGMDDVARRIGRHVSYCMQPLRIAADESYAPQLKEVDCLQHQNDIVVLIDDSSVASRPLYRDLVLRADIPEEIAFWDARANAPALLFQQTSCEERARLDLSSWTYSAATVYLRVMDSGVSFRSCMRALPYLIFGQLPVKRSNGRQDLVPQLLELQYSSDLAPGMGRKEVEAKFSE